MLNANPVVSEALVHIEVEDKNTPGSLIDQHLVLLVLAGHISRIGNQPSILFLSPVVNETNQPNPIDSRIVKRPLQAAKIAQLQMGFYSKG